MRRLEHRASDQGSVSILAHSEESLRGQGITMPFEQEMLQYSELCAQKNDVSREITEKAFDSSTVATLKTPSQVQ